MPDTLEALQAAADKEEPVDAPVADSTAEETTTTPEPETAATPEAPESDEQLSIRGWIDELTGLKIADKYKTDEEMAEGIANLYKRIGQRDEEAELGRYLREHESEFREYLASKQQPKPAESKPEPQSSDVPEWDENWRYQVEYDEAGNLIARKGSSPDIPAKIKKYMDWRERRLDEVARNPEKFASKVLEQQMVKLREEATRASQEEIVRAQEQAAIGAWGAQHSAELMVDGDVNQPTMLGKKYIEVYESKLAGMPDGLRKIQTAYEMAKLAMPQAKPTKKPLPRSLHQPPVSPGPGAEKKAEQLFAEGKGLAEVLELLNREQ